MAVFPGDKPFNFSNSMSFANNDHLTLGSFETTTHIGAHTDAPIHYHRDGETIESRELNYYYGHCQVITVQESSNCRILPKHIKTEIHAQRVLLKTLSYPDPNKWNDDFFALSKELVEYFHQKNVITIGIDTPSVDPCHDQKLISHNQIYDYNMAIIEGLVLSHVKDGFYKLIALPLKLKHADSSPVRAVLIKE